MSETQYQENLHFITSHPEAVARHVTAQDEQIATLRAEVERLTAVALAAEKESTYEHFEAHIDRMGDENATLRAANERLRAALEWFADAYNKAGFIAAAYVHKPECRCLRCAHDNARAALAQEKQDD